MSLPYPVSVSRNRKEVKHMLFIRLICILIPENPFSRFGPFPLF